MPLIFKISIKVPLLQRISKCEISFFRYFSINNIVYTLYFFIHKKCNCALNYYFRKHWLTFTKHIIMIILFFIYMNFWGYSRLPYRNKFIQRSGMLFAMQHILYGWDLCGWINLQNSRSKAKIFRIPSYMILVHTSLKPKEKRNSLQLSHSKSVKTNFQKDLISK